MLYYNLKNKEKLIEAINNEARKLGVRLVAHSLDRTHDYDTEAFQDLEHLIERTVKDIKGWFSSDNLAVKEMCASIHFSPLYGEYLRIQTRCKR